MTPRGAPLTLHSRIRGTLLGGALGDAFGAPHVGTKKADLRALHGRQGPHDLAPYAARLGAITARTQLVLFVAEGLLRAHVRGRLKGICHMPSVVHHAMLRWLSTQRAPSRLLAALTQTNTWPDGWLARDPRLHARRDPAPTLLASLAAVPGFGQAPGSHHDTTDGLTHAALLGLWQSATWATGQSFVMSPAYRAAVEVCALTPAGYGGDYAAGAIAQLVGTLVQQRGSLRDTVRTVHEQILHEPGSGIVTRNTMEAMRLASRGGPPSFAGFTSTAVWRGVNAGEALAIVQYVALRAKDFAHGVRMATFHDGDSATTASIVGQVLGAAWGEDALPAEWLAQLELRDAIETLADDLTACLEERFDAEAEWERYPGW